MSLTLENEGSLTDNSVPRAGNASANYNLEIIVLLDNRCPSHECYITLYEYLENELFLQSGAELKNLEAKI